jgi:hypothetical protein
MFDQFTNFLSQVKAGKALGVEIPPNLIALADQTIE